MNMLLHTTGKRDIEEIEWCPTLVKPDEIMIKTWACGVCRSDVAAYAGWEKPMPFGQQGHEGLGTVTAIGSDILNVKIGDYVATWSDPAYSDFYKAKVGEYVKVPELKKDYILQPSACAINIARKFLAQARYGWPILIIGSGFMSLIIGQYLKILGREVVVAGSSHKSEWDKIGIPLTSVNELVESGKKWKGIIDLSSKAENFDLISKHLGDVEAVICYAATPFTPVTTNFFDSCWNCHTFIMPSPRNKDFNDMMRLTAELISLNRITVGNYWTQEYNRSSMTEVKQAFEDGVNRPSGYLRGYIRWN